MDIVRVVPDITSDDTEASRAFYTEFLGFEVGMDLGWVATFISPSNPTAQVTVQRRDEVPGVRPDMSVEVSDVSEAHARALARGLEIVYPLTEEPWGVRRFFVVDPNGVVINVLSHT